MDNIVFFPVKSTDQIDEASIQIRLNCRQTSVAMKMQFIDLDYRFKRKCRCEFFHHHAINLLHSEDNCNKPVEKGHTSFRAIIHIPWLWLSLCSLFSLKSSSISCLFFIYVSFEQKERCTIPAPLECSWSDCIPFFLYTKWFIKKDTDKPF